jgi:hypothetical protein
LRRRQNEYEYFCHREYHLEQTKFCYLIPHFESHFSNLSFPPGLGYFGTAPIEISPDLLKSILSVYTSFVQRYITSVNELGKLLLSFLPAFFMLVTSGAPAKFHSGIWWGKSSGFRGHVRENFPLFLACA